MDYPTLVGAKSVPGSIKSWVNYEKIDPAGCLEDAQSYIYGTLRCREMRFSAAITLTSGATSAPLPSDFLDPVDLRLRSSGDEIQATTEKALKRARFIDGAGNIGVGEPAQFSIWGEAFQFDAASDQADTLDLIYYGQPPALSDANPTNFLTRRYPALLRSAAMMAAGGLMSDDTIYVREQKRTGELLTRALIEADYALRGVR